MKVAGIWLALWLAAGGAADGQLREAAQLLQATNFDRAQHGLGPLHWDAALMRAAQAHAFLMVRQGQLSHQYAGEADLATRTGLAGAHFQVIAENLAVAPNAQAVEGEWMHSSPHRQNILDARLNAVGIGVVRSGGNLWSVEDYSAEAVQVSAHEAEQQVEQLLHERGVQAQASAAARATCAMQDGAAGSARPAFVMRWQAAALDRLPTVLEEKLGARRFHAAEVGVCSTPSAGRGFTGYKVAVLLF